MTFLSKVFVILSLPLPVSIHNLTEHKKAWTISWSVDQISGYETLNVNNKWATAFHLTQLEHAMKNYFKGFLVGNNPVENNSGGKWSLNNVFGTKKATWIKIIQPVCDFWLFRSHFWKTLKMEGLFFPCVHI